MSLLADDFKYLEHNRKIMAETKMLLSGATIDVDNVRLHFEVSSLTYSFSILCQLALIFIAIVIFCVNEFEQCGARNYFQQIFVHI